MQGTHRPRLAWTKRQREVLDLLAQGKTNAQIGERLGISLDGAKWHVSEILGHLGVDSREAAAAYWREERQPMRRLARFGSGLASSLGGAGKAAIAGGGLLAAVGLAAGLVLYSNRVSDDPQPNSPGVEANATATPSTPGSSQAPIFGCPVDQAICDFALEQERNVQARDIAALIDPSPWQRSGDRASFADWFDVTFPASEASTRLVTIGCPQVDRGASSCDQGFALTFSYLVPQTLNGSGPGIGVLLYERDPAGDHELRAVATPDGPDRIYALEGIPGSPTCYDLQVPSLLPGCSGIDWFTVDRTQQPAPTTTLQGVAVVDLALGDPWELPDGLRVYTSTIAYATDFMPNPPEARRFVTIRGQLMADDLFATLKTTAGIATAPSSWHPDDRFETFVAVVEGGRLYRSTDGGASWRVATASLPANTGVVGLLNTGTLLVTGQSETPLPSNYRYWILETGADISPPQDATTPFIRDGELFWNVGIGTFEHVVDGSGQVVFEPDLTGIDTYLQVVDTFVSGDLLTGWSTSGVGYIARHTPSGDLQAAWRWTGSEVMWVKAVISDDLVLVNALPPRGSTGTNLNLQVGIVDLRNGVVHFLPQLSEGRTDNLSPFVEGVVVAATMQVNSDGECLNLRAEPRLDAPLVACIPDGMLVDDLRRQQPPEMEGGIGGREWYAVRAPGYGNGWVAGEFLRR